MPAIKMACICDVGTDNLKTSGSIGELDKGPVEMRPVSING